MMKGSVECPVCKKLLPIPYPPSMPFCSDQCRMRDLGRWMNEEIGLPHTACDEDESEADTPDTIREIRFD